MVSGGRKRGFLFCRIGILGSIRYSIVQGKAMTGISADFMTLKRIYRGGDYEALNQNFGNNRTGDGGKTWDSWQKIKDLDILYTIYSNSDGNH
jgi:hypothetical protein